MDTGTRLGGSRAGSHYSVRACAGRKHGGRAAFYRAHGQTTTHGQHDYRVLDRFIRSPFPSYNPNYSSDPGHYFAWMYHHNFPSLLRNCQRNGIKMMKSLLADIARFITGENARCIGVAPETKQRIYFANHSSHLDVLIIWASLPPPIRDLTRPVGARDY